MERHNRIKAEKRFAREQNARLEKSERLATKDDAKLRDVLLTPNQLERNTNLTQVFDEKPRSRGQDKLSLRSTRIGEQTSTVDVSQTDKNGRLWVHSNVSGTQRTNNRTLDPQSRLCERQ